MSFHTSQERKPRFPPKLARFCSLKTDLTEFIDQPLRVSVACNRVTVCVLLVVTVRKSTVSEVCDTMKEYTLKVQVLGCPSAPQHAIIVLDEADRPQLRLDRETERGYACSVRRIMEHESGILTSSSWP
jgi:aspartate-semialdehyde dehydrogenase